MEETPRSVAFFRYLKRSRRDGRGKRDPNLNRSESGIMESGIMEIMPLFWPGVSTTVEALLLKAEIRGQLNKIFARVIYKCSHCFRV